jgi:ribonuclease P protein component
LGGTGQNLPRSPATATGPFRRRQRLLKPAEFKRVFAQAVRAGNGQLLLLGRPNGLPYARLGLGISKKHLRSAVARNRVKRQVRENFRRHQYELAGLDIIVLSRPGLAQVPNGELRAALERHWRTLVNRCVPSS